MSSEQKLSIGLFAFSVFYLFHAYKIPNYPFPVPIDADVFPTILGYLLLGLSLLLFWEGRKKVEQTTQLADAEDELEDETWNTASETEEASGVAVGEGTQGEELKAVPQAEKSASFWSKPAIQFAVVVTAMILYALLIEAAGFVLVTMVFLFGITRFLGYRRHIINGLVACLFSVGMFYVFTELLKMNLPKGVLSWIQ